jgi:hypothetical protein
MFPSLSCGEIDERLLPDSFHLDLRHIPVLSRWRLLTLQAVLSTIKVFDFLPLIAVTNKSATL